MLLGRFIYVSFGLPAGPALDPVGGLLRALRAAVAPPGGQRPIESPCAECGTSSAGRGESSGLVLRSEGREGAGQVGQGLGAVGEVLDVLGDDGNPLVDQVRGELGA